MGKKSFLLVGVIFLMSLFITVPHPPANAADPIVLGLPLSLNYLYGWDAEKGIRLAVEEINAKGGVNVGGTKRPFKVEVMETRDLEPGVPVSEALLAVEKLILEKNADFIMGGPVRSEAGMAAMDLLAKYKKVSILTTGVLTPKYHARVAKEYDRLKYMFRATGEGKQMVKEMIVALLEIEKKTGFNKMYLILQDVAHSRAGGKIMAKLMKKKGWEIVGSEIYPTGASDFSMSLFKMKKKGAQILFTWLDMPEATILMKQWSDLKIKALPFGFNNAGDQPGFWNATEGKAQYSIINPVNAGNAPSNATPWTMKFYNAYEKRWGIAPEGYGCSTSYMGPYILKDAIERAGTLDSDAVVAALEKTDMVGVQGRIRFDPKSHQIIPSFDPKEGAVGTIFQWIDGERIVLYPKSIAMGELQLPPWMLK